MLVGRSRTFEAQLARRYEIDLGLAAAPHVRAVQTHVCGSPQGVLARVQHGIFGTPIAHCWRHRYEATKPSTTTRSRSASASSVARAASAASTRTSSACRRCPDPPSTREPPASRRLDALDLVQQPHRGNAFSFPRGPSLLRPRARADLARGRSRLTSGFRGFGFLFHDETLGQIRARHFATHAAQTGAMPGTKRRLETLGDGAVKRARTHHGHVAPGRAGRLRRPDRDVLVVRARRRRARETRELRETVRVRVGGVRGETQISGWTSRRARKRSPSSASRVFEPPPPGCPPRWNYEPSTRQLGPRTSRAESAENAYVDSYDTYRTRSQTRAPLTYVPSPPARSLGTSGRAARARAAVDGLVRRARETCCRPRFRRGPPAIGV